MSGIQRQAETCSTALIPFRDKRAHIFHNASMLCVDHLKHAIRSRFGQHSESSLCTI